MREQGKDETSPDAPEAESLGADFWRTAHVVMPGGNFCPSAPQQRRGGVVQSQWKGHLTRMKAVLKAYAEARNLEARNIVS